MGIYQVVAKMTWLGQQVRNVLYFSSAGPLDTDQKQELADKVRLAYATLNSNAPLNDSWSLDGVYLRDVASGGIPGVDLSFTSGVLSGTGTSDPLPAQVALLIIGRSGTVKPNQVRSYVAGFGIDAMDVDGLFESDIVTDVYDWAVDLSAMGLTGDTVYRVAVNWTTGEDPYVDDTNEPITYAAKPNPATQKRRRIGRGS